MRKMKVLLFGPYADAVDGSCIEVALPALGKLTAGRVMVSLNEQQPKLRGMLGAALLAVDYECVRPDAVIEEGDELALIGLVGGG